MTSYHDVEGIIALQEGDDEPSEGQEQGQDDQSQQDLVKDSPGNGRDGLRLGSETGIGDSCSPLLQAIDNQTGNTQERANPRNDASQVRHRGNTADIMPVPMLVRLRVLDLIVLSR
jgi:hypothetical protein